MKALFAVFLLLGPLLAQAQTARDIVQQVIDRDDGKTQYSKTTVATCKYTLTGGRLACSEQPRVKVLESATKDYGKKGKDKKTVMIIHEPASERGIGFLQYDYDEQDKDSDQWMFLSALGKIKRIVSGDDNQPKTGTLFGSEFGYEDTEQRHIDDFTYKLLKEETLRDRPVWVIESIPTPKHARKSNYSRSEQWIDKERFVMLKVKLYDRRGKLIKQMSQSDFVQKQGIWIAKKLNMNNVQSQRISTMKVDDIVVNLDVDDELLTKRTLSDAAFRSSKLEKLRSVAK
ncbi:MAG: outer membrane lipoprotein-sorting protein [Gammaproteobacteria bacterium]|nr:outer membrane lipoprotein-sorting protein [Gammaproteobacteria bacterium]MDH5692617.1 outer membrane lipoprotein-sorting protein [Gammaproteobacteria bacterium]